MYEVKIEDISFLGKGVTKINGYTVFVDGGITGDILKIELYERKKRFGLARIVEIISPSPYRIQSDSKALDNIPLQFLNYEKELKLKRKWTYDTLSRNVDINEDLIQEVIGMNDPDGYRNKAQIPVRNIDGKVELGIFKNGSREFIPVENFYVYDKEINESAIILRDIFNEIGLKAYDIKTGEGTIRNIILRKGHYTNEIMIVIVAFQSFEVYYDSLIKLILERIPNTVSVIENINTSMKHEGMGRESNILFGQDRYYDKLFDYTFAISSKSFYQVNTLQTEILYRTAIQKANIAKTEIWLDAFSGIGTMSILMAEKAKYVYGIEIVEDAVKMANINKEINEINNVEFICGDVENEALKLKEIDGIIVDPPRAGLGRMFIEFIMNLKPEKFVYVSCNPVTLAQDLKKLTNVYSIESVQPVDMFPHTPHVETVVLMSRVDK